MRAEPPSIGERVRWARDDRGLTRPELAKKAGISVYTLTALELRQPKNPGLLHIQQLAQGLGLTMDELLSYPRTGPAPAATGTEG